MHTDIRALEVPSTTQLQVQTLLTLISLSSVERVDLFAGDPAQGAPALVFLATGRFPGIGPAQAVFDCLSLTVDSAPRYAEVRELLDLAVASGKCVFCDTVAPPTAHLSPQQAAARLRALQTVHALNHNSRHAFFALISEKTERDIMDTGNTSS